MDNSLCLGADLTVGVDVSHNVVAHFLFPCLGNCKIYVVNICLQLVNLLLCNIKSKLHFGSCKGYPEAAEGGEFLLSGEDVLHFLACVAGTEGAFVGFVLIHIFFPFVINWLSNNGHIILLFYHIMRHFTI